MILDAQRRRLVLYGGGTLGDGLGTLGDAWLLELGRLPVKRALLVLITLATTGCYSFSDARPRAHARSQDTSKRSPRPKRSSFRRRSKSPCGPIGEIGARVGVARRCRLEGRVTTLGGSLAAHVQLRRDPSRFGVEAMLAPGIAFTAPDKLAFELPILFGIQVGHDNQIVIAPRAAYQLRFGVPGFDHPIAFIFLGGSLGFAWRVVKHFTLMPEVSFLGQAYAEPGFGSNVANTLGMQLALGALFDF